jgi:hypothetical protein
VGAEVQPLEEPHSGERLVGVPGQRAVEIPRLEEAAPLLEIEADGRDPPRSGREVLHADRKGRFDGGVGGDPAHRGPPRAARTRGRGRRRWARRRNSRVIFRVTSEAIDPSPPIAAAAIAMAAIAGT